MSRVQVKISFWCASFGFWAGLLIAACPGQAQQVQPVQDASKDTGAIRYNAAFFASQRPKTALDMVNWIPGFTFSAGDVSVRGFSGAAGNVLIDGERPADKRFALDQLL